MSQDGSSRVELPHSPRARVIARGAAEIVRGPVRVGYVHSVFRRAANLWAPPNTLLAIAEPTAMRVPNGVVIDLLAGAPEEAFLGLGAAMPVWIGDGCIRVPAAGCRIEAVDVPLWDPRPQFPERSISAAPLAQRLDRLARLLRDSARGKRWSFASVLDPLAHQPRGADPLDPREDVRLERLAHRARPAASDLLAGLAVGETDRIWDAARRLAGLGHGLTPSGDDFLIGICGALALAEAILPAQPGCRQEGNRLDQARTIAAAAEGRTTLMSAIWLDYAARGEFSAEVGDVLVSLADAEVAALETAVARLLAIGGLSGLDTAMGVLLGSRAALTSCSSPLRA